MEGWYLILVSISIALLLKAFYDLLSPSSSDPNHKKAQNPLPPGPPTFPIVGNFLLLRKSSELEPILRSLHSKLGAMVTLRIGPRPAIFVADRTLAHQALVQNGAVFANRPRAGATSKILSSNLHNISSNSYGTTWRLLRRNLTSEILHPSRVKSYSHVRKWVLQILLTRLDSDSSDKKPVRVVDHFDYAMFCLLALMCFGDQLDEKQIKELERVERNILLNAIKYNILNFFPRATKILMRKKWEEFLKMRKEEEEVIIPLIRARERVLKGEGKRSEECVLSYVDTLFNLELLDEKRKLNDGELVSLCHEFFIGGTGTSTALQWIMANLVKYPRVQEKLFAEMREVVGAVDRLEEVREEELSKMQYLKAVVLEGLRRHPPGHLLLPHAVSEDVVLGDYLVPKDGSVNFMVADMGWDPAVWEDPMEFRPERFVGKVDEFDITGSKGIKMMPFGAGKRMCPGYGLAMLHLQYFVANLVWRFEWKEVEGVGVDLSEKQEFTAVMKFPLQAQLIPREKRN